MTIKEENKVKAERKEILINKIKKLLALTENNFEGEAEAAILKAQELLLKYNLTMQDVTIQETLSNVTKNILEYPNPPWWYKNLVGILVKNFRCEVIMINFSKKRQKQFVIIGREHDVEIVCEVFKYAAILIKHNSKPFAKHSTKHQNMYIVGFLNGLSDKFKEQVENNNYSLVLVKDKEVLAAKHEYKPKPARKSILPKGNNDTGAFNNGYVDGKTFNHQQKRLETSMI